MDLPSPQTLHGYLFASRSHWDPEVHWVSGGGLQWSVPAKQLLVVLLASAAVFGCEVRSIAWSFSAARACYLSPPSAGPLLSFQGKKKCMCHALVTVFFGTST